MYVHIFFYELHMHFTKIIRLIKYPSFKYQRLFSKPFFLLENTLNKYVGTLQRNKMNFIFTEQIVLTLFIRDIPFL